MLVGLLKKNSILNVFLWDFFTGAAIENSFKLLLNQQ